MSSAARFRSEMYMFVILGMTAQLQYVEIMVDHVTWIYFKI